ncbi:prepilin-type N-terminal cleavage/methylation domain-containing protein [Rheinheimera sp.]|uniref:type IV pilus modification PilV family protein n=1 Tax=Rheinheimera sp. TaxID=1869214 RepID=UPI0027B9B20E|nr:prepilin-type N-terminal cleavage/methylation domain-containing protein [Rheinheimera sp.]
MKGFTLFELLICCLLFSLGMLGALSCQIYARQQVLQAQQRLIAAAVAADVMSSLQSVAASSSHFQADIQQKPTAAPCNSAGLCDPQMLLQAQLTASVGPLFAPSALLPQAQLCIRSSAAGPAVNLSWQPLQQASFQRKSALCPVRPGHFQLELLPGRGL